MKRLTAIIVACGIVFACVTPTVRIILNDYRSYMEFFNDVIEAFCTCDLPSTDYQDTSECIEDLVIDQNAQNIFLDCIRDSIHEVPESPPYDIHLYFECSNLAKKNAINCLRNAKKDCNFNSMESCWISMEEEESECFEHLTNEGKKWLLSLELNIDENDCYSLIEVPIF